MTVQESGEPPGPPQPSGPAHPSGPADPSERSAPTGRRPQTFGGGVYLVVLGAVLTGLALVVAGAWRSGVIWIGAALVAGSVVRLLLPERQAGMLRVRRKGSDVLLMLLGGAGLITMALWIPAQRV